MTTLQPSVHCFAAAELLTDAGHQFSAYVVVAPAVEYRVDASRARHCQHLETEIQQAEEVNRHGCSVELDDQRQNVPRQPKRDEVDYDERQQSTSATLATCR